MDKQHQINSLLSANSAIALLSNLFKNKTLVSKFSVKINNHSYNKALKWKLRRCAPPLHLARRYISGE